jgi:serine/threonine protein kinase
MESSTFSEPPPRFERKGIGQYDIIYPLASGGMASIYVGRLSGIAGFEKLVTVKIIHSHLASQRQFVEMFLDEARLVAKIHHPNIGEIYEVAEENGQLFIAAEFIDGHSLRHLLRAADERNIGISHPVAAWICAEVLRGLEVAHTLTDDEGSPLNIVHRDISPSNIMISYNGWVKLIDFGIAFAEKRMTKTVAGTVKGKFGYISPEQLKGAPPDRRADIFCLGVILYQLITGRHPFPGETDEERLRKTIQYELATPKELLVAVDDTLESIILKAMAESPEDRYQNASSLERDLRRYIASTREMTGASDVERIMQTLFEGSKTSHRMKLSEFKHNTPTSSDPRFAYETKSTSVSKKVDPETTLSAVFDGPQKATSGISVKNLVMFAVIGGLIASVITAGIIFLLTDESGTTPTTAFAPPGVNEPESPEPKTPVMVFKEDESADQNDGRTPLTASGDGAPKIPELVTISVTLKPKEATLLLNGNVIEVKADSITVPGDGRSLTIIAEAQGYAATSYTIIARTGETLLVDLPRSPPLRPLPLQKVRGVEQQKTQRSNAGKKTGKILKENPY